MNTQELTHPTIQLLLAHRSIRRYQDRRNRRQFKTKVVESKSELAVRKLLLHNGLCD